MLKTIVDGFAARISANGLVPLYCGQEYWNFYEWTDGMEGKERHNQDVFESPFNAFVSDAFRCFAKLCEPTASELAEKYKLLHHKMNRAMHELFFDEHSNTYRTRLGDEKAMHALTQGLLLYVNAIPEEYREAVAQAIMSGKLIPSSLSMTIYVYEALLRLGEEYRAYVIHEIERIWGGILLTGADTFWETVEGSSAFDFAGSLCHGWSAVPVYLFSRYL